MMDESLRRSGPLASPAGVGTGLMSTGQLNTSIKWSHQTLAGFPSKPESRPAQRTPSGYVRKEPLVHAIHEQVGAGMSSVIDNTLRIKPLPPKWGKAREIVPAENTPPLRILAPATLAMSKVRPHTPYLRAVSLARPSRALPYVHLHNRAPSRVRPSYSRPVACPSTVLIDLTPLAAPLRASIRRTSLQWRARSR